jgi:hypothetical protein
MLSRINLEVAINAPSPSRKFFGRRRLRDIDCAPARKYFERANDMANGTYNSEDLAMLSRVLEEALAATIDGVAVTDAEMQELSSRLGKVIMDRFTAGETDPEVLKRIAVESTRSA